MTPQTKFNHHTLPGGRISLPATNHAWRRDCIVSLDLLRDYSSDSSLSRSGVVRSTLLLVRDCDWYFGFQPADRMPGPLENIGPTPSRHHPRRRPIPVLGSPMRSQRFGGPDPARPGASGDDRGLADKPESERPDSGNVFPPGHQGRTAESLREQGGRETSQSPTALS